MRTGGLDRYTLKLYYADALMAYPALDFLGGEALWVARKFSVNQEV